uniref:Gag-pol polyprotein n=1 Tax=Mycena chlorophos TaxID=658473 RepID=A0ABQ0LCD2_MYCCL|nr:gag-pol polyprotein [Mycena chlorophos]
MNYLFSDFIGQFMDVYLDDIIIYSNSLDEHIEHVKKVIDVLREQQLYLSEGKLQLLKPELRVLGRIVDDRGIRMDPDKVDSVLNWKTPTNRDLLRGFLGSVGYLADDLAGVRIPMGILHTLTSDSVAFRWEFTHQRAFEDIKRIVGEGREHRRSPLVYGPDAPPVWLVTDGCSSGVAGVVCQGPDWKNAKVAAFFSAKLNPAQQNYPVHEIEMLAGVEAMLRHRDILQGCRFAWITDHKGLIHLVNQKNLSGRQARWIEKISGFDFEVKYVPGTENVLADALSRIYSNEAPGTVRARSEYTYHDVVDNDAMGMELGAISMPVLTGPEAQALTTDRVTRSMTRAARAAAARDSAAAASSSGGFGSSHPPAPKEGGRVPNSSKSSNLAVSEGLTTRARARRAAKAAEMAAEGKAEAQPSVKPTDLSVSQADPSVNPPVIPVGVALELNDDVPDDSSAGPPPAEINSELEKMDDSLLTVVNSGWHGLDLAKFLANKYDQDLFFKHILENPKGFKNFEVQDGLIYLKETDRRVLCVPRLTHHGRNIREIIISEAHSILAHLGTRKTLDYLRDHVWWKEMVDDTQSFCETCATCKRSKSSNQKPYGLLQSLIPPASPWDSIGIDFVGPLPESKNRDGTFNSITVVIDLLTGMVHLVPSRINYTARQLAELMFEEVYKLHGLPKSICISPNQRDWVAKLPAIEFAMNSARSESTGYAPFFLNTGRMPRSLIWNSDRSRQYPGIAHFALQRRLAVMAAHDSMLAARVKQTRFANRKRQPVPFSQDDLVYLSTKNIKFEKGLARKLIPKYIGPYRIVRDFGNSSFQLDLPGNLKQRGVHDVFHASLLRIHIPNDDRRFPGRLESQLGITTENTTNEWAVNKITNHYGRRSEALFEVLWTSGDTTWMPYSQANHLTALNEYFEVLGISDIRDLGYGSGTPPISDAQLFAGAIGLGSPCYTGHIRRDNLRSRKNFLCLRGFPRTEMVKDKTLHDERYAEINALFEGVLERRAPEVAYFLRADGRKEPISPNTMAFFVQFAEMVSQKLEQKNPGLGYLNPTGYVAVTERLNSICGRTGIGFPHLSESQPGMIYPAPDGTRCPTHEDFLVRPEDIEKREFLLEGYVQVPIEDIEYINWAKDIIQDGVKAQLGFHRNGNGTAGGFGRGFGFGFNGRGSGFVPGFGGRGRGGRSDGWDGMNRRDRRREEWKQRQEKEKSRRGSPSSDSVSESDNSPPPSKRPGKKARRQSPSPERRAGPSNNNKKQSTTKASKRAAKEARAPFKYSTVPRSPIPHGFAAMFNSTNGPTPTWTIAAPLPAGPPAAAAVPVPAAIIAAPASTPDVTMTPASPHWTEGVLEPALAKFAQDLEREKDAEGEDDTAFGTPT